MNKNKILIDYRVLLITQVFMFAMGVLAMLFIK
jgi:hypothetical protein